MHIRKLEPFSSRTIEIKEIGFILIERSKRAKRINISIKPFQGVRVAVPYGMSFEKAEQFIYLKLRWIKKHILKIKKLEQEYLSKKMQPINVGNAEARGVLITHLNDFANKFGFKYNRLSIRNQKTRWGSCSAKNNINLNINLVNLPQDLMDYVILHELVHTRFKNHSKEFWLMLNQYVSDARNADKRLKKYRIGLL